jgi:hypothetical protein
MGSFLDQTDHGSNNIQLFSARIAKSLPIPPDAPVIITFFNATYFLIYFINDPFGRII